MHKLHWLLLLVLSFGILFCEKSGAISESIVISQVQLGDGSSAKNEFVELYNNSSQDIEITNWCLYYQSSGLDSNRSKMVCFAPKAVGVHIFLPSHANLFIASNEFLINHLDAGSDFAFSVSLSGVAGYVKLFDSNDVEIDQVGWGVSTPENNLIGPVPNGKVLSRVALGELVLKDTDISSVDFIIDNPRVTYQYGATEDRIDICLNIDGIQEIIPNGYQIDKLGGCQSIPVDICPNIAGDQFVMPNGFGFDNDGNCQIDFCMNIVGIQETLPDNFDQVLFDCNEHDECVNIKGYQHILPDNYYRSELGICSELALPLIITEILPNVIGIDDGNEFIEIYNPNDVAVDLTDYLIYTGLNYDKFYSFPVGLVIASKSYLTVSNDDIKFTLLNTSGRVRIAAISGQVIDDSDSYVNPIEGESWSLINGVWKYTNQVTRSAENIDYIAEEIEEVVVELKPCAVGYYRSSETNRCRKIIDTSTELAPCKDGQYRSEETGRCRNIVSDVVALVPCSEGEERNPATNRCRKIASVLAATSDCPSGQTRNPETNRCKSIAIKTVPSASYKPKVAAEYSSEIINASILSIIAIALVYGVWEWHWEISRLIKKDK